MEKTEPVIVTILRHGEVCGRSNVLRGRSETALSKRGIEQMYVALARAGGDGRMPQMIGTSPLVRCCAFAEEYGKLLNVPVRVLPGFAEMDFGAWEGLSPVEIAARDPAGYAAFRQGEGGAPQGETIVHFRQRVAAEWQHWLAREPARQRLLVTHAGVMRALMMELFGFTAAQAFQMALPEAATLRISHLSGYPPFLLGLN